MQKRGLIFNLLIVMSLVITLFASVPGMAGMEAGRSKEQAPEGEYQKNQDPVSPEEAYAKLHSRLQEILESRQVKFSSDASTMAIDDEPILINILAKFDGVPSAGETLVDDLARYFYQGKLFAQPIFGKRFLSQTLFGKILPSNLLKVAFHPNVVAIYPIEAERAEYDDYPIDNPRPEKEFGPEDWALLRENAEMLRENSLPWSQAKAIGDGAEILLAPDDWYETSIDGPNQAEEAWQLGYRGQGVAVSTIDDGVDFGHPDLMGTQKIYSSTVNSQYNGWPMVIDPFTMRAYAYDVLFGTTYISGAFPGVTYVDTTVTPELTEQPSQGTSTFHFTPLIDVGTPDTQHTYTMMTAWSQSGVVHVGTHHDESLRDYVWGERVAVLVTDPNTAGVYDTVYVDLNADYDFTDEKPLTRADVTNSTTLEATYNNMIAYRDLDGDGLADLSGGMLYFIADGVNYIPASEYMYGGLIPPPGNGDLVAIHGPWDSGYSHGTQVASNVVANGVIDGMLPSFRDLPGDGEPKAAVYGAAPEADLVAMNNGWYFTGYVNANDAYVFAAVGWDGIDQTGTDFDGNTGLEDTDTIVAHSNSYGWSADFNDGFDFHGQFLDEIMRNWAPYQQVLFSTGNGGPGYGTVAPPSPGMGIGVGASTQYGSTGWDTITDTLQINWGDIAAFSNSGPGARQGSGVDVVAVGAFAAGAEELNYYATSMFGEPDGNVSWSTWGGTSRSSPAALGVLALIYQAYYENNGVWPTSQQAKALFMSSATDLNTDVFKQGAGQVNAWKGVLAASGRYGVYMDESSFDWVPGDYREVDFPGFAHIVKPGQSYAKTFTIKNDSNYDIDVSISDVSLSLIDTATVSLTVTADQMAGETDNFYKAFQYFIPITATQGMDPGWYNIDVPEDTDLMVVRQRFPYDEFDSDGDYVWDNRFYLMVYNWSDINEDGLVWTDTNENGRVDFIDDPDEWTSVDVGPELDWDDPATELQRWEYGRFGYNRPYANVNELLVQNPLGRMHDGLFIGLRHLGSGVYTGDAHLAWEIEFYRKTDNSWLSTDASELNVPAYGSVSFDGTLDIPVGTAPGDYQAAIEIYQAESEFYQSPENTVIIPVAINVAAEMDAANTAVSLGGQDVYLADAANPYNNAATRGYFDWGWREESGDWRMFYLDIDNTDLDPAAHVILKNEWEGAAPHNDIDTVVLGPTLPHEMEDVDFGAWGSDFYDPAYYGPYDLETIQQSDDVRAGRSIWRFNTTSGSSTEWLMFPMQDGLHEILHHNVLFEGDEFDTVFTTTIGLLFEDVHAFDVWVLENAGELGDVTVESTLDLSGLVADAYIKQVETYSFVDEPIDFIDADTIEWYYEFSVTNGTNINLQTSSSSIPDLDLYLFYWNGTTWEEWGSSAGADANEAISVVNPDDGQWRVGVLNWSGPAGDFNLDIEVLSRGLGLSVTGVPEGPVDANTPVTLSVSYDYPFEYGVTYEGVITLGPPEAPELKAIPVSIALGPRIWHPLMFKEYVTP